MKKTRFTDEQMVTILREADRRPVPEVAKRHGVSAQTIYGWRKHFGTLEPADVKRSGRPGSLLTLAPHRSGRAGSAASGSSTDGFATRRRVPAGPGSQAMATAIPKAYLASSAIRCRDVETGPGRVDQGRC